MADDKFFIDRRPEGFPPDAFVLEFQGVKYVNINGSVLRFDAMNRLCSWWIQYIAEHPQPEVNSVTEEK